MNELIIDCHQHLIMPERFRYDWCERSPVLGGQTFDLAAYREAVAGKGPIRTIFMETSPTPPQGLAEAKYVQQLADDPSTLIDAVIARCAPESDEAAFDAYLREVMHPKLVGLRRTLHTSPDQLACVKPFVQNIRKLAPLGLTFDLCVMARQLPMALELVVQCPDVQFVLDHCGNPNVAAGTMATWIYDMQTLADRPNVACKVSGILVNCDENHATLEAVSPYVRKVIDIFGWDRVVFGSDWPVVNLRSSAAAWIDMVRAIIADDDIADQRKLLHENAQRIYLTRLQRNNT